MGAQAKHMPPTDYPESLLALSRSSPYGPAVLRAWALFVGDGNKARVSKRLRGELKSAKERVPHPQVVENWLRTGEQSLAAQELTRPASTAILAGDDQLERGLVDIAMGTDGDARPSERIAATRTLFELRDSFPARKLELTATHHMLTSQPIVALEAEFQELCQAISQLEGDDGDEAGSANVNDSNKLAGDSDNEP